MSHVSPQLLARYVTGDLPPDENERVFAWLQAHPDVRANLEGLPPAAKPDIETVLRQMEEGVARRRDDRLPRRATARRRIAARAGTWRAHAAGALVLTALVVFALFLVLRPPAERTYMAGFGARDNVTLQDGSRIVLNAASRLTVERDFGDEQRIVTLDGEAYFDVATNPDRPFTVRTSDARVTALGTAFNVEAYAGEPSAVVVAEGRVQMRTDRSVATELRPGERGRVHATSGRIVTDLTSVDDAIAWREGRLVFRGTPLADVALRLERQYGVRIHVDADIDSLRLDGTFDRRRIEEVATLIAAALEIEVSIKPENVTFSTTGDRP